MTNSDRCNCKWCGSSEGYAGTQECDQCYNIRSAIETNPQLAARMLNLADDAAILDWMADNQVVDSLSLARKRGRDAANSGEAGASCFRCGKCGEWYTTISDALECCEAKEGER